MYKNVLKKLNEVKLDLISKIKSMVNPNNS